MRTLPSNGVSLLISFFPSHNPDPAMRVLKAAQECHELSLDDVALYGAQIHAVVPGAGEYRDVIHRFLAAEGIHVTSLEWVAPSLEDVLISPVRSPP
jgi:hypothetical protein